MNHKKMRRILLFGAIAIVGVVLFIHFFSKQPVGNTTPAAGAGGGGGGGGRGLSLFFFGNGNGKSRGHAGHVTNNNSAGGNAATEPPGPVPGGIASYIGPVGSPLPPSPNPFPILGGGGAIPSASY